MIFDTQATPAIGGTTTGGALPGRRDALRGQLLGLDYKAQVQLLSAPTTLAGHEGGGYSGGGAASVVQLAATEDDAAAAQVAALEQKFPPEIYGLEVVAVELLLRHGNFDQDEMEALGLPYVRLANANSVAEGFVTEMTFVEIDEDLYVYDHRGRGADRLRHADDWGLETGISHSHGDDTGFAQITDEETGAGGQVFFEPDKTWGYDSFNWAGWVEGVDADGTANHQWTAEWGEGGWMNHNMDDYLRWKLGLPLSPERQQKEDAAEWRFDQPFWDFYTRYTDFHDAEDLFAAKDEVDVATWEYDGLVERALEHHETWTAQLTSFIDAGAIPEGQRELIDAWDAELLVVLNELGAAYERRISRLASSDALGELELDWEAVRLDMAFVPLADLPGVKDKWELELETKYKYRLEELQRLGVIDDIKPHLDESLDDAKMQLEVLYNEYAGAERYG